MNVLVLGGQGYIGRRLCSTLVAAGHLAKSVDLGWFGSWDDLNTFMDYSAIRKDSLAYFDAVVVVAGHSSVAMCAGQPFAAAKNNVSNMLGLVEKLEPEQRLVYLSSGSVYGGAGGILSRENDIIGEPLNEYDASKRSLDWFMQSQRRHQNWYGLRCSTVSGWSDNLRTDLMINAMWDRAKERNCIEIFGGIVDRPLVSIRDLCATIAQLLSGQAPAGIYNLRSFNSTNRRCAAEVGDILGAPVVHTARAGSVYNFRIDDSKLRSLGIECNDTIYDIVMDLEAGGPSFRGTRELSKHYS